MGNLSASEFLDNLFSGVDIIIDKRLQNVSYDSTIICTIVDDSNRKNGIYRATDGSTIYTVYSDLDSYMNGEQVRVQIPMGDYSQKKYIIGKYVSDSDSTPLTFVSPADKILNISDNLIPNPSEAHGLVANGKDDLITFYNNTITDKKYLNMQKDNICTDIVLKANFRTLLSNYDLIEGNFGLRLDLKVKPNVNSSISIHRIMEFDSSEMFGNPYSFSIKSPQAKVFKINTLGIVETIALSLYQKNNFKKSNGDLLVRPSTNQMNDIIVSDIVLSLGCDLGDVEDNTLQIYCEEDPQYNGLFPTEATNLKNIGLLWLNKDDDGNFIGFSDGIYDPDYDELEYLEKSRIDTRLVEQKGKENIPLDKTSLGLAANIEEAVPNIVSALKVISTDIIGRLRELKSYVDSISTYMDNIDSLIVSGKSRSLMDNVNKIYQYLGYTEENPDWKEGLIQQYAGVLKYGYETASGIAHEEAWKDWWPQIGTRQESEGESYTAYFDRIKNYNARIYQLFDKIESDLIWLFNEGFEKIDTEYSGYLSIYNTYQKKLEDLRAKTFGYLGFLLEEKEEGNKERAKTYANYLHYKKYFPKGVITTYKLNDLDSNNTVTTDFGKMDDYINREKDSFKAYTSPELSSYDNKYCIYWFRYEPGYEAPQKEQILDKGWRRLKRKGDFFQKVTTFDTTKKNSETYIKNKFYYISNVNEDNTDLEDKYVLESEDNPSTNKTYYKSFVKDNDGYNVGLSSFRYYEDGDNHNFTYLKAQNFSQNKKYFIKEKENNNIRYIIANPQPNKDNFKNKEYYLRYWANEDGKRVHAPKPNNGRGILQRYMATNYQKEQYKAVLFYNHEMFESNILEFSNKDPVPDETTVDQGDILIFKHLDLSSDSYQVYGITNYLMDASDEYRIRTIQVGYDGLYAKDNAFVGGYLYWYVPNNSTMLTFDLEDLLDSENGKGFTLDDTKSTFSYKEIKFNNQGNSISGELKNYEANKYYYLPNKDKNNKEYSLEKSSTFKTETQYFERVYSEYCFYKQITATKKEDADNYEYDWEKWDFIDSKKIDSRQFWYKIKPYYEANCQNNYIKCEFQKSTLEEAVHGTELFTFGIKGTSGTKYTLAINNRGSINAASGKTGAQLVATLKDFDGKELPISTFENNPTIEWIGYRKTYGASDAIANQKPNLNYLISNTDLNFDTGIGCYGIIKITGRIELQGTEINSETPTTTTGSMVNDSENKGRIRSVDLQVLHAIPFSGRVKSDKTSEYSDCLYLSGPTQIIYNNLGTLDNNSMFNKKYELFAKKKCKINGITYEKGAFINGVKWSIKYYKVKNGKFYDINDPDEIKTLDISSKEREFYSQYMPTLNKYQNTLIPAPMYLAGLDCYAIVEARSSNDILLWRQPLIILQNKYSSSLLNDWDGSLQIDEENGTILATMIGAGRKSSNNTFEGVVMGDVAIGTGSNIGFENGANIGLSNQTGLGLYGFYDGAQSFGFNIDGTAFIGQSGGGRIIFNGRSGTIASANWFTGSDITTTDSNKKPTYPKGGIIDSQNGIIRNSDQGMCIDLFHGHIDAYDFRLTSNNIHLNSNPTDKNLYYNPDSGDPYYLRIGKQTGPGYIALDSSGQLNIRVNSLNITPSIGSNNLLKQTSPRKIVQVPYYIQKEYVTSSYEDNTGKVQQTTTTKNEYYETVNLNSDGLVDCTWKIDKWYKLDLDGNELTSTTWSHKNSYASNKKVKHLGNIWTNISGATIDAHDLSPAAKNNTKWRPCVTVLEEEGTGDTKKQYVIKVNESNIRLRQSIKLEKNKEYTLSGYVKATTANQVIQCVLGTGCTIKENSIDEEMSLTNESAVFEISDTNWHYFKCIFSTNKNLLPSTTVGFQSSNPYLLWQVQLETGSIATAWSPAPEDGQENVDASTDNYNSYLQQDVVFDKLFRDPKTGLLTDGIQLLPANSTLSGRPELYICATYIATGILRSKNWDGKLTATIARDENDKIIVNKDGDVVYRYGIKTAPTKGMYINLDEGKVWAAKFELDAWNTKENDTDSNIRKGLYLNSSPLTNNDYYLKIGDTSNTYITFSKAGKLIMRVNEFELSSPFGGENLLNNTDPIESSNSEITSYWKKVSSQKDNFNLVSKIQNNRKSICLDSLGTGAKHFYQDTGNKLEKTKYILSGKIYYNGTTYKTITFKLQNKSGDTETTIVSKDFTPSSKGWHDLSLIFDLSSNEINNLRFRVEYPDGANVDIYFYHLKLEQGTVATQWSQSQKDLQDYTNSQVNDLNGQLDQDGVFNRLTKNGTVKGIFLKDGQLYINATYIATGIIRSENWSGRVTGTNGKNYYSNPDDDQLSIDDMPPNVKAQSLTATSGMYINLNNGKIWSKTFDLDAWTDKSGNVEAHGLRINSHPVSSGNSYFRVGIKDTDEIQFYKTDSGTALKIVTKNLTLNAGTKGEDYYLGLFSGNQGDTFTIGSSGAINTWRIIAGKNFGVTRAGILYASGANISGHINASTGTIAGFNIGRQNATDSIYPNSLSRRAGDYEIGIKAENKTTATLVFYVKKTKNNWSNVANSNDNFETIFYVDTHGKLYAKNAEIDGYATAQTVTALEGKFTTLNTTVATIEKAYITSADVGSLIATTVTGQYISAKVEGYANKMIIQHLQANKLEVFNPTGDGTTHHNVGSKISDFETRIQILEKKAGLRASD